MGTKPTHKGIFGYARLVVLVFQARPLGISVVRPIIFGRRPSIHFLLFRSALDCTNSLYNAHSSDTTLE
jgi:hypothetical protein